MNVPISQIFAATSEIRLDPKPETKSLLAGLKPGQRIEARVDRAVSPGHVALIIRGKPLLAKTLVPLQPGQSLILEVAGTDDRPMLRLIESRGGNLFDLSKALLGAAGRPSPHGAFFRLVRAMKIAGFADRGALEAQMIKDLDQFFASQESRSGPPAPDRIKTWVDHGGLFWEKKLARILGAADRLSPAQAGDLVKGDLKGLLLRLLEHSARAAPQMAGELNSVADSLEGLQLLNRHASDNLGRFLIPLPIPFDEPIRFGQVLIDLGKDRDGDPKREDRVFRVSLLLEMSRLGHLKADLSMLKDALTVSFQVQSDSTRQLMEAHLPELRHLLVAHGFTVYEISCRTVAPQLLAAASLADHMIDPAEGGLNLII